MPSVRNDTTPAEDGRGNGDAGSVRGYGNDRYGWQSCTEAAGCACRARMRVVGVTVVMMGMVVVSERHAMHFMVVL
ncbi:hypothetical protein KEH59_42290 (plasmid) [Burkholderia contaminans]|uniref:hypothetical protein n=1 Tax=Burkholderia contaminans TaxID=488447 RepID=UPI001BA4C1F4|nr:hypothetical protein KEH59_42290 [Burkholderia contaminans]